MKFLHTADWQIGMKAEFVGSAGERVRNERLSAGQRVVEAAESHGAEFILVAGDLFENNAVDRTLVQRTADILAQFPGPVYLIAGNHDPLVPGSVWDHPVWDSFDNLLAMTAEEPVEISQGLLFPCPIRDKYSRKDPTAWIFDDANGGIRIGVAHGNVEGLPQAEPDHPIPRDAATRCGLDYLALGHWHSTTTYPDSDDAIKMAYSGTPETSRFGERDSGHTLIVEIENPGDTAKIQQVRTGRFQWRILESDIEVSGDLLKVRKELEGFSAPEDTLLDLRLKGILFSDEKDELFHLEDIIGSRFLYARMDSSGLILSPEDSAWIESLPGGILQEAGSRLQQMVSSGGKDAQIAAKALLELYAAAGESSQ